MRKSVLAGCLALAMSGSSAWAAVSVFEDFWGADPAAGFGGPGTALDTSANGGYWTTQGSNQTANAIILDSGNSPGKQFDSAGAPPIGAPADPFNYNSPGIGRVIHNAQTTATVSAAINHGSVPRDPTTRKVYFSIDIERTGNNLDNYIDYAWRTSRGTATEDIAFIRTNEGGGLSMRGFNGVVWGPGGTLTMGWNRICMEATYSPDGVGAGSLSGVMVNAAGTVTSLGSGNFSAGPLFFTNANRDPNMWRVVRTNRGDGLTRNQNFDLMTTSNVPIDCSATWAVPEPATVLLLGVGALPLLRLRRGRCSA